MKTRSRLIPWLPLLAASGLHADTYTVSVPDYQATPGSVVKVPLMLDEVSGLARVRLQMNYDASLLTLTGVSPGPLGALFDVSQSATEGSTTIDFIRATALAGGSGRLAVLEFQVNPGATPGLYSDLAVASFELGDASGVSEFTVGNGVLVDSGSVTVSLSETIDNAGNGIPDWWELENDLDLFSPDGAEDPDGDTLNNFLEFAFGGDPGVSDQDQVSPAAAIGLIGEQRYLTLTFRRRQEPIHLNYLLQEGETLTAWSSVDPALRLAAPPLDLGDGMESVTVRGEQPLDGPGSPARAFMRISVLPEAP